MNKLCIYHANCADGFAAATIVNNNYPNQVDFHPGVYGEAPPDVTEREVIMVDFSYKRNDILRMAKQAKSILIIDHHKTAQNELAGLPNNVETIFDLAASGCVLTWNYFAPNNKMPLLLAHIQDRDLWLFKMEGSKRIHSCITSYKYDFQVWNNLFYKAFIDDLIKQGDAILRKQFKNIYELIDVGQSTTIVNGYNVPILNVPYMYASDAGHIMAENNPFAITYWVSGEKITFSLRSVENGLDVSEIALSFGGGGHKHAAGFSLTLKEALQQGLL